MTMTPRERASRAFKAIQKEWKTGTHESVQEIIAKEIRQAIAEVDAPVEMTISIMPEADFLKLYAKVVDKARALLAERNKTCGDNWPAGQDWDGLGGSSKSIFMISARKALLVDDDEFLTIIRGWPYSGAGKRAMETLYGNGAG